jgi:2-polyprenyl-3-methyl-5-hydroxy-6-metoxy-1,4-benzoquinol methylase
MAGEAACKICGSATLPAGSKRGVLTETTFRLQHCPACGFGSVENPYQDYERIYDESYYRGEGADPLVDYSFELEHPEQTIRSFEWRGIVEAIASLLPLEGANWLDYGCGNGGLVRYCNSSGACNTVGFESGWIATQARQRGIPVVDEAYLASHAGHYDVVTAIEVIEHVVDPLRFLREVRKLLKPGGLFFLTTGNAAVPRSLETWTYVRPEIHVSFFEPRTLDLALAATGFRPERRGFLPGWDKIIRFKVLKTLGVRRSRRLLDLLPWKWMAQVVDRRLAVTAHPIGWAV